MVDYEKLLVALKNGTLSLTGKQYTSEEIDDLKTTRQFRDRYGKYIRKQLWPPQTIVQNLDTWFCHFKVTATDPIASPAGGRLDPFHLCPLFTGETKPAVENCKLNAVYLEDPLPLEDMYDKIPPHPSSKHQLTKYCSKRGESK